MLSFFGVVLSGIFLASFEKADAFNCNNGNTDQWMCTDAKVNPTKVMLNFSNYVEKVKKAKEAIN